VTLTLSCAFATSLDSHEHARIAEQLGYRRAWFYDSPAVYPDVWVQLNRAADVTSRIGLGPGVLVPALRHPMVNAAAIAALVAVAGAKRVMVGVGSGFTGRLAMGQRPMRWADVERYVIVLKGLLRGERVEWDGGMIQLLQRPGFGAARPIDVPFVVGAAGPKGIAVARRVADGVFGAARPVPGFDWSTALLSGTVLDDGEDPGSARVLEAAGPAASTMLHGALELGMIDRVPGGRAWAAAYDDVPEEARHLALHDGHLVVVTERDRPHITPDLLTGRGFALSADGWRAKLTALEEAGATEVAYQPAGPNIPRELEAFAAVAR
jgi:5,10-methylenetetrahydromethanopterin reductase